MTSTLRGCFVMDVKTTGDKWEVINVTVLEKTLLSLEK